MSKKNILQIDRNEILDRLKFENPWWVSGKTEELYRKLKHRAYFDIFYSLVRDTAIKRAVVLMGPRRVGKTVMMQQAAQQLLDDGRPKLKVGYINIENPLYTNMGLEKLFKLAREASLEEKPAGWYVFFDEIQYLKDWERHLKSLTDSYPETKFIVSGSAASALRLKSSESGAGRFTDFLLPPLTFHEYLYLLGYDDLIVPASLFWRGGEIDFFKARDIEEVNNHFIDYINYGGYPEVIFSEEIKANPKRFIKSDIIDKVLLRDLPSLYGIQDVQELNAFFSTLAYHTGSEVSLEALSQSSGVEKYQIKNYLEYLEAAFLIKPVHRIDDSAKKFQRKTFYKIYLTNPSLRSALFYPLNRDNEYLGNVVETAIFAQRMHREGFQPYYARWNSGRIQGEVDLVLLKEKSFKPGLAMEMKWSNRFFENPASLKSLLWFCKKNDLQDALVTTINKTGTKEQNGINISFFPAAVYAYGSGLRTIEKKQAETNSFLSESIFYSKSNTGYNNEQTD